MLFPSLTQQVIFLTLLVLCGHPSLAQTTKGINCDKAFVFRKNELYCLHFKLKQALIADQSYLELIRQRLYPSNPAADDIINIEFTVNVTVQERDPELNIIESTSYIHQMHYGWCSSYFKLAVYDAGLTPIAVTEPATFTLAVVSGLLGNLDFQSALKAENSKLLQWISSAYYGPGKNQALQLRLSISVPALGCNKGKELVRNAFEKIAPWLREYARQKQDEELEHRGYISPFYGGGECSVGRETNTSNEINCQEENLIIVIVNDGSGLGSGDVVQNRRKRFNYYDYEDDPYYYDYDYDSYYSDNFSFPFYYDFSYFVDDNFYLDSAVIPTIFHNVLGEIFLAAHIILHVFVCLILLSAVPALLNASNETLSKDLQRDVFIYIASSAVILATMYNLTKIVWTPLVFGLIMEESDLKDPLCSIAARVLLSDLVLLPFVFTSEFIVSYWFVDTLKKREIITFKVFDRFQRVEMAIYVLAIWNGLIFIQSIAPVALAILPQFASDPLLTVTALSLFISGTICLVIVLAKVIQGIDSVRSKFSLWGLASITVQIVIVVLGAALVVLAMIVYTAFLNGGGNDGGFGSWVLGLLPSAVLSVVAWIVKRYLLVGTEPDADTNPEGDPNEKQSSGAKQQPGNSSQYYSKEMINPVADSSTTVKA